jgi:hypothetical protein
LAILVGVPGVGDLVKEYVRSKTLEPVS